MILFDDEKKCLLLQIIQTLRIKRRTYFFAFFKGLTDFHFFNVMKLLGLSFFWFYFCDTSHLLNSFLIFSCDFSPSCFFAWSLKVFTFENHFPQTSQTHFFTFSWTQSMWTSKEFWFQNFDAQIGHLNFFTSWHCSICSLRLGSCPKHDGHNSHL